MQAIIIYWSAGGNTEKVAQAVYEVLSAADLDVILKSVEDAGDVDYFAYDLVCVGFPSYQWHPPKPMDSFLKHKFNEYHKQGRIRVSAPKIPGKHALIFCTYSGQHTGLREATPAGLYAGQFFEHLGFTVLDELYVVGQFHGDEEANTKGRLGDIRGRPNEKDLEEVKQNMAHCLSKLKGSVKED
jgi:hypothetical protein